MPEPSEAAREEAQRIVVLWSGPRVDYGMIEGIAKRLDAFAAQATERLRCDGTKSGQHVWRMAGSADVTYSHEWCAQCGMEAGPAIDAAIRATLAGEGRMAKPGLTGSIVPVDSPMLRHWHASFKERAEAWRYFTKCDAPGVRLDGDDWYGWHVTSRNLDAERTWGY